jgi:hypothetical protein
MALRIGNWFRVGRNLQEQRTFHRAPCSPAKAVKALHDRALRRTWLSPGAVLLPNFR